MADDLSSEPLTAANDVTAAGAEAVQAEPDPGKRKAAGARAIRSAAQKHKLEMTQEDADMIADALVARFEARGAFDEPPEPVVPPATAPEEHQAPSAAAAGQPQPEPPRKRSWAEKFRGVA